MKFFGGLLMAVGILIAMPSGLCGAWLLIALSDPVHVDSTVVPSLMIVAVPFVVGIGLIIGGSALARRARKSGE